MSASTFAVALPRVEAAVRNAWNMRTVGAAALSVLGSHPTALSTWQFAWNWWFQRATAEVLSYQADRLTPVWAQQHVAAPAALPSGGCVLVSVHHYNQRLAFARLSSLVDELGCVSLFEPLGEGSVERSTSSVAAMARARWRARSRFCDQVFGSRMYPPQRAARHGLELLQGGGSLIVLSDMYGREPATLLGKQWLLPSGATWWAQQSGRPIVPFAVAPMAGQSGQWQLWCGEPIPATLPALAQALEECIRRTPTAWTGWPAWYAAPNAAS